mmetsp:Transcript_23530/g.56260  ORF Transcript_23530/g.56260 Transcript_23530/m.56260 type:complete len:282 (-) Transcript_23530:840-1685(-)
MGMQRRIHGSICPRADGEGSPLPPIWIHGGGRDLPAPFPDAQPLGRPPASGLPRGPWQRIPGRALADRPAWSRRRPCGLQHVPEDEWDHPGKHATRHARAAPRVDEGGPAVCDRLSPPGLRSPEHRLSDARRDGCRRCGVKPRERDCFQRTVLLSLLGNDVGRGAATRAFHHAGQRNSEEPPPERPPAASDSASLAQGHHRRGPHRHLPRVGHGALQAFVPRQWPIHRALRGSFLSITRWGVCPENERQRGHGCRLGQYRGCHRGSREAIPCQRSCSRPHH